MDTFFLKLYIAGHTSRSKCAINNLYRICEEELNSKYEIMIVDVLERPQQAEDEKIIATPTLIKLLPPPVRRVIGDLSNKENVLLGLDIIFD